VPKFDVIILGGGAAGLMCAIEAGKRGRSVAVLERGEKVGKKILISGGGRCNFTNLECGPANFLSQNPHFAKSALARYTSRDFIAMVERHGIPYHEKTLGQLFCDRSARDIIGMLQDEYDRVGVEIFLNCDIGQVERGELFQVQTNLATFESDSLVIATGGPSIPKMGATSFGYRVAAQFGLKLVTPYPALVPFTVSEKDRERYCDLSGLSAEVVAQTDGASFREKMLITHRGLSGPAILQISSYWKPGEEISMDLLPQVDIAGEFLARKAAGEKAEVRSVVAEHLPKRFVDRWFEWNAVSKRLPDSSMAELTETSATLHAWKLKPGGTEGYAKAEVTGGGVDTAELSSRTFEAKKVPGLYFIGEVVDVTGHLGGFNFQWAWASGYCAGQFV
jgi:predicted Rossmann fold flavoprotein